MKLKEFLDKNNLSAYQFAQISGISRQNLSNYITGRKIPRSEHAKIIYKNTKGEITPNDFYAFLDK